MSGELRVLLVGTGRAGLVHGRNFAAGVRGGRLTAVADPNREALAATAVELGCELQFDDPLAAVVDERVDAVVVASPTFTHAEIAITALEAGKHVLCEKPLCSSLTEAALLAEAVDAAGTAFVMGFMRRYDEGFRRAADAIAAGEIGRPLFVRSTGRGPGLPPEWAWDTRVSGGLIAEVNSHDLDTIRWLSGQELETVYALGRAAKRPDIAERYPGFIDLVTASFELSDGGLAQLDGACPAGYGYDARVEVYGSEGAVFAGDTRADATLVVRSDGARAAPVRSWRNVFGAAYVAEDVHFIAVARGEAEPRTTLDDGRRALEAVVAVNAALAAGVPVEVAAVAER